MINYRIFAEKFITFSYLIFILISLILLITPKELWPEYYSPIFFAFIFLMSAAVLILLKYVLKPKNKRCSDSLIYLRLALSIAIILNGLGELYLYQLYKVGFQYDKILHFMVPFMFVIVLTVFGEIWFGFTLKKSLSVSLLILILGSAIWEMFEYFSDAFFKTSEFGIYGEHKLLDTTFDILFDIIGIILGISVLKYDKFHKKIIIEYCRSS